MKRNHLNFFLMGFQNAPGRFTLNYLRMPFLENKNYFLLRMIQYLHSMECRTETGGVNPTDGERVSQGGGVGVGADRDKKRKSGLCACSAVLCLVKNPGLKKQLKDWGGADWFQMHKS